MPQRTKEEKAQYMKEYREKNREKLKANSKKWYHDNIDYCRAYNNAKNKLPQNKERRAKALRKWRANNPERSSAFSGIYYLQNRAKVDETHAKWDKKAKAKRGSPWKYYGLKKCTPISHALCRAWGTKKCVGDKKTIKKDIVVLRNEISRLKGKYL